MNELKVSTSKPLPLWSIMFVALACLVVLGVQGWQEWTAQSAQMHETSTFLINLASSLAQHAEDTIELADTAVAGLVARLETDGTSPAAMAQVDRDLATLVTGRTRYWAIFIVDAHGDWLATSLPAKGTNLSDRPYFRHLRDSPDRGPFIGHPVRNRTNGSWVIQVSRRLQSADGSFAGVVAAVINLSYFVDHYATYDLGANSSIGLLLGDGTLLARYPSFEQEIGADFSNGGVFKRLQEHPVGSFRNKAILDGVQRFTGYSRSSQFGLVAVSSIAEDVALADWRADMRIHMVIAIVMTGGIGLLGLHLIRQLRRSHAIEEHVRQNEARYRLQAENLREANERVMLATDSGAIALWEWNIAQDRMVWDTWMYRLFGLQPADTTPRYEVWQRHLHPDDRAAAEQAVTDCMQGGQHYNNEFRVVWDDGSVHHLRSSGRLTHDAAGRAIRLVGASWDVTSQRVEAEQRALIIESAQGRINALEEFRAVVNTMVDGLVIIDEHGLIKTFTPVAERLFGYKAQEVLEQNVRILMPKSDGSHHDGHLGHYLATGEKRIVGSDREVVARRKDGSTFPMDLGVSAYKFSQKTRFVGIIRDVTERREVEKALRHREESLQLAWRGTGVGMWDWNVVTNELIFSDRFSELLGFAPGELPQHYHGLESRLHPDDKAATQLVMRSHFNHETAYDVEYRLLTKSGEWRWFHVSGQAMWNADGEAVRMAGSLADVTESKKQQQALTTSEETIRSAMEAAAIGMALVSPAGDWLMVNPALCGLLGSTAEALLTSNFRSVMYGEDLGPTLTALQQMLAGEIKILQLELRCVHRSGRIVWVHLSASLMGTALGEAKHFVWQLQDITERKQIAIMQDEFVSTVNHELRTPLSSVYGAIRLLKAKHESQLDQKALRLVELADVSCVRLSNLVNDILDLEKITAGKMMYSMETVDFGTLVKDIVERHLGLAEHHDVSFRTKLNATDVLVHVDPSRFNQSLVNLLSNAAKYSPKGGVVTIEVTLVGDEWVRMSVTDHGPGIPEAFRPKVFQRFAQADSSATRKVGGSGLGLNITKRIIEAFGGSVSFDTAEGEGTTFHFLLPIAVAERRVA